MSLQVRAVTREAAIAHLGDLAGVSFLQSPSWGEVRAGWSSERLGWFDEHGRLCGYALVLRRAIPGIRRQLAYIPEGPVLAWGSRPLAEWLDPFVEHLRAAGAFAVKMSPHVVVRSWEAQTVKAAIAAGRARRLDEVPADDVSAAGTALAAGLREGGWRQLPKGSAFPGEAEHAFQVPLAGRSADDVLAGLNQQWRRNIRKADRAGVDIVRGEPTELATFHRLYSETAARSGFQPWPLDYFQRLAAGLGPEDPDRVQLYLARHDGEAFGAAIDLRVGTTVGYGYGGSTSARRDVQPNNLLHWRAIRHAIESGADVYDMRGIDDSLDPRAPKFGILQFKLGTGGRAVQYVGEWDLPLNRAVYQAFLLYSRQVDRRTRRPRPAAPAPVPAR